MSRTTIGAVLAMLLMFAPAASAMPVDPVYSGPTAETKAMPKAMPAPAYPTPEFAPNADEIKRAFEQEQAYSTKGNPNLANLVREQESTSGSGNQGPATASAPSPAPAPSDDDAPWLIVALGIAGAALGTAALIVVLRRTRTSVAT